jgi:hypothetical protein
MRITLPALRKHYFSVIKFRHSGTSLRWLVLDILYAFLAGEDPVTKRRLVRELPCIIQKKNSKMTYVAALGLTVLYIEGAPSQQCSSSRRAQIGPH